MKNFITFSYFIPIIIGISYFIPFIIGIYCWLCYCVNPNFTLSTTTILSTRLLSVALYTLF